MRRRMPIFYSALMLTGVNLLLRLVGTSFQVYLSGRIGPAGIGLLQLVLSVGSLAMVAGIGGIRTATMYLTAEELGKKRPQNVAWVLSGCFLYSILFSGSIAFLLYHFAPWIAENWIGDTRILGTLRLFAAFLPVSCLCGVMTGYFTGANRIGTLAAVEIAEQLCSMVATLLSLTLWAGHDPVRSCLCVVLGSSFGASVTLVTLVYLRIRERQHTGSRIPVGNRLMQAALPLALADDLKSGITTAENLMVPKRMALFPGISSPLASFGIITGMVFPVLMFPAAILFGLSELLIPELARCNAGGSRKRILYLVRRSLRVAAVYGIFFCGLLYLLSDSLCMALYNNVEAGHYLRWFSLLIPMLYCDAITDAMIKGMGQQKVCVRYNILTSVMDVALLYVLLPRYGVAGYFASFLITHVINFALSLRRLLLITKLSIPPKVPMLCIFSTFASIWAASHLTIPVARTVAFLIILSCLLFLLGILRKDDILWLQSLVRKKRPHQK